MRFTGFDIEIEYKEEFGNTLQINPIPGKICYYDCLTCPLKRTEKLTATPQNFEGTDEHLAKVEEILKTSGKDIDIVIFNGSGEPFVNARLGEYIELAEKYDKPVWLTGNGYLLKEESFHEAVNKVDELNLEILYSDAETYDKFTRHHEDCSFEELIDTYRNLRNWYKGNLTLEFYIGKGMTDNKESIEMYKRFCDLMQPDQITVRTVDYNEQIAKAFGLSDDELALYYAELVTYLTGAR